MIFVDSLAQIVSLGLNVFLDSLTQSCGLLPVKGHAEVSKILNVGCEYTTVGS